MLTSVVFVLTCLSCVVAALLCCAVLVLHVRSESLAKGNRPISVLKPVKGLDDDLEGNLESFCRQTHPCYELIIGAADPEDPALAVARRVQQRNPGVAIQVVAGQWPSGQNPKIRNLRHLLRSARHEAILVSDADVRVEPDYLRIMAAAVARPNVGLVSNLVVGVGARSIGSMCENLQLNSFVVGGVAAAEVIAGHSVVVGKSMLFRRDALTNAGGFAAAADVLAEDYLLGRAVAEAGYQIVTLGHSVQAVSRDWNAMRMVRRHTRWSQIRRQVAPTWFALEPLGHPLIWPALLMLVDLLSSKVPLGLIGWSSVAALELAVVAFQGYVMFQLQGKAYRGARLLLLPLQSMLALWAWLRAWTATVVTWRRQSYRIGPGSRLYPLTQPQPLPGTRLPEAA